ncbi:9548_t:CDS:2, partial [Funneliformis mosseae]
YDHNHTSQASSAEVANVVQINICEYSKESSINLGKSSPRSLIEGETVNMITLSDRLVILHYMTRTPKSAGPEEMRRAI